MDKPDWIKEFPGAITVCDASGAILEMNDKAAVVFAGDDETSLVGRNVLDCHPEPARSKLTSMLESGKNNVYTITKKDRKKLIFQSPWYRNGEYAGFVELSLEIPEEMPHFNR